VDFPIEKRSIQGKGVSPRLEAGKSVCFHRDAWWGGRRPRAGARNTQLRRTKRLLSSEGPVKRATKRRMKKEKEGALEEKAAFKRKTRAVRGKNEETRKDDQLAPIRLAGGVRGDMAIQNEGSQETRARPQRAFVVTGRKKRGAVKKHGQGVRKNGEKNEDRRG